MRTAWQAYHGLAGLFLVSDPEAEALRLPSGDGELLFVLQDRRFDAVNQLSTRAVTPRCRAAWDAAGACAWDVAACNR